MAPEFDIVTFDCYGTLIDWEAGILEAFHQAAAEDGIRIDDAQVLETYAGVERQVEQERYRLYRDVLWETAARVAHGIGWPLERQRAGFVAETLPSWKPFPDTNDALRRLKAAGFALGILSNIDDDLLAATRQHFTVDFDVVVTAQQVSSYKPAHAHFEAARQQIGGRRWLHAAQSNYHDIVPANALGIATAWINRHGARALPGGEPSMEYRNLDELAASLAA